MPTIQYSAQSPWLMAAHGDIFWNQIAKFQSLTAFQTWNCKFPLPNTFSQTKCNIYNKTKTTFSETRWHSGSKMAFQVRIAKLLTSNSISKLKWKIYLWKNIRFWEFPVGRCMPPNRLCVLAVYFLHSTRPSVTWLNSQLSMAVSVTCAVRQRASDVGKNLG